jgi:hypothetical protein
MHPGFKTVVVRLDRAIQYAAASRFITTASGIPDHPLSRVITAGCYSQTYLHDLAAHVPEVLI